MPSEPVKWATSAETEAVSWPIDVMNNAPWNILDSTGTRVAICGYDNDHEKSGPRLAYAIVGMIRNLKADNETLRHEYEREDRAHEQTAKERDVREEALDAFVDAVGGVEVCGEHSNMNDPWANALREVQDAHRERDELRKNYADACGRVSALEARATAAESRVRELEEALTELLEVADLRGDSDLPHPSNDPKLWTSRMQEAWDNARTALATKGAETNG